MSLSTQELEEFLKLVDICDRFNRDEDKEEYISEAISIAPPAVRELIEARELLRNHLTELQDCQKTLSAYGHSRNWMAEIERLIKRTQEYLGE